MAQYDVELMIKVAELYYVDDMPQKENSPKVKHFKTQSFQIAKGC